MAEQTANPVAHAIEELGGADVVRAIANGIATDGECYLGLSTRRLLRDLLVAAVEVEGFIDTKKPEGVMSVRCEDAIGVPEEYHFKNRSREEEASLIEPEPDLSTLAPPEPISDEDKARAVESAEGQRQREGKAGAEDACPDPTGAAATSGSQTSGTSAEGSMAISNKASGDAKLRELREWMRGRAFLPEFVFHEVLKEIDRLLAEPPTKPERCEDVLKTFLFNATDGIVVGKDFKPVVAELVRRELARGGEVKWCP